MIYHCDKCAAALPGGAAVCPGCGKTFEVPVPTDADAPFHDILRGRTASGPRRAEAASGNVPNEESGEAGGGPTVRKESRPIAIWIVSGLLLFTACTALVGWGGYSLWMQGAGGEEAYRQHNLAGNAAVERGDFPAADAEYGQMIALRPHRVDGYLLRGISETKEGLHSAAIQDETTALLLTRDPMMRGDLLYNRGVSRKERGDEVAAVADLTASLAQYAVVRDPQERAYVPTREEDDYRVRAEAHWQHKDFALSATDSGATIACGHARPEDYALRAKAEAALARDAAAEADFSEALRLDPSYQDGHPAWRRDHVRQRPS